MDTTIREAAERIVDLDDFRRGCTIEAAAKVVDEAAALAEIALALARKRGGKLPVVACGPGCAWCCAFPVAATPFEMAAILLTLRRTLDPVGLANLAARVHDLAKKRRAMTAEEWDTTRTMCPLLGDDQNCGVYNARPLSCRGHNSVDANACRHFYETGAGSIDRAEAPIEAIGGAQEALATALARWGMGAYPVELVAGLDLALNGGAVEAWLSGKFAVFRSAVPRLALPCVYGEGSE